MAITAADALVSEWFLARYGAGEVMRKVYDPGTGHAAQIAELEATRTRLREDRQAGLYDDADDAEWFRTEYRRAGDTADPRPRPTDRHQHGRMADTHRGRGANARDSETVLSALGPPARRRAARAR